MGRRENLSLGESAAALQVALRHFQLRPRALAMRLGDFEAVGLYRFNTTLGWRLLTAVNPFQIGLAGDNDVYGNFGPVGLYRFNGTVQWQLLTASVPLFIDAA